MSSTRSRAKKTSNEVAKNKIAHNKHCDMKVFFLDGTLIREDCDDVEIILLRNPCTDSASRYLYAKHLNRIYEVMNFAEEPRSWFINDMACANGNLYLTTAFDPLFFALHYIKKNCSTRCVPFDQAIEDEAFAKTHVLVDVVSVEQLSMIANQKGDKALKAFQYDEAKTLKWLTIKCNKLCDELQAKNFHIGAKSAYFIKSEKFDNPSVGKVDSETLSYAFGMLSEYISDDLSEKLSTHLGLEKVKVSNKRKSLITLENKVLKRLKSEEDLSMITDIKPVPVVPEKKVTAKEKSLAKAASGTKSISSFFKKM